MRDTTIAFIGGGNMARSLIGGLLAAGTPAARLRAADPDPEARRLLAERFGVATHEDNAAALEGADAVVLAVKPQVLRDVAETLAPGVQRARPLVVSIAAGVRTAALTAWLGGGVALVRAMPNTPALVRSGATALYATPEVGETQRETAESILRAVGATLWLDDEAMMDAVTAVSGSGPAYLLLVMEAIESAAVELGLPRETARLLTLETAFGAAKLALEADEDVARLRARVTSPGGTTERALEVLEAGDLRRLFREALTAARDRSRELAARLGGEIE
ncbi:MAG: pyrroline-5-carboxylate reductase [Gammaproteobacteria bacterium]|nr:pyrroline-5-carboxylate reductase [Gammaproteobacteria bacterium]